MKDFVIKSLEIVVWILSGLILLVGVITGLGMMVAPGMAGGGAVGPLTGLLVIVVSILYAILIAGLFLIQIGTYQNTKRTADLMQKLLDK